MGQDSQDNELTLGPGSRVHIVGIGGAGMSAIARILLESGSAVSGSDRQANDITHDLARHGATIHEGHAAQNISGAQALFVSSAIKEDNPELIEARVSGIPILTRRQFFKYLLPDRTQIAVAGTHGKTTTTALIIHLLRETGHDPSYIVGGTLNATGDNAHVGKGKAFVVEADEYGGMFLGLSPKIAVLTNVEWDHPDQFPTLDDMLATFRSFLQRLPAGGTLIACADDPHALALAQARRVVGQPCLTYSISSVQADWQANLEFGGDTDKTQFMVRHGDQQQRVSSPQAGTHNVLNCLAALAAVYTFGVPLEEAANAVRSFAGTGRRFEIMGQAGGVTAISDYGHHPTAIRATLQAARQRYPGKTIWAIWQPHTYSRTRTLASQFATAFSDADHVLITDIYAARETPAPGDLMAGDMALLIAKTSHADARHSGDLSATESILAREIKPGAVVIIFSAGDAPRIGEALLRDLKPKSAS